MIAGIGTDIIEIRRVTEACENAHFLERIFTEKEQALFRQDPRKAAGNFAVKEAVAKALGTGFRGFGPGDIEVRRDGAGAPCVTLFGAAEALAKERGIKRWHVSISHTDSLVTATVIGEG